MTKNSSNAKKEPAVNAHVTPPFAQSADALFTATCTATMMDGTDQTVSESCMGRGDGMRRILAVIQANHAKWAPFAGCEVIVECGRGSMRRTLNEEWGTFSLSL